jgi:hypothetical protein
MSEPVAITPPNVAPEFRAGIDDLIILPLVLIAFAIRQLLRGLVNLLIWILDFLFPILLQVFRFPLFTLRMIGDALAALLKFFIRFLPVSGDKRSAWREKVAQYWAWLRQRISYRVFEEWVHHAFEAGMAWVFKRCKNLTPGAALLVLLGAVLWLPISFGIATLMHMVLFAKVATWPAWMQLLHPVATIIAKSKLLVLPVYPASWPRAKEHPVMQAMFAAWRWLADHYFVQKFAFRYQQIEAAAAAMASALGHAAGRSGLRGLSLIVVNGFNRSAVWVWRTVVHGLTLLFEGLSKVPLIGAVMRRYAEHYEAVERRGAPEQKLSEKVGNFYERWSIKFTAEYYEAKEREEAAKAAQQPAPA